MCSISTEIYRHHYRARHSTSRVMWYTLRFEPVSIDNCIMRACSTDDICTHATRMLYTITMEMKLKKLQLKQQVELIQVKLPMCTMIFYTMLTKIFLQPSYSVIFCSCQFIKSFRPFHSFWEEDLSWEINTSFIEWHHCHIMGIQFQGHPANSAVAYL